MQLGGSELKLGVPTGVADQIQELKIAPRRQKFIQWAPTPQIMRQRHERGTCRA